MASAGFALVGFAAAILQSGRSEWYYAAGLMAVIGGLFLFSAAKRQPRNPTV